ncbi:MAG: FAD-dependent oxidoreductase [Nocardioidaceae bacterium]
MAETALPTRAQVVVVGGGVVGTSVAYQLAKRGWTDVVLLEQHELTSGTTWHAAGLVAQHRATDGTRQIVKRSLEVFHDLEAETGFSTGYHETTMIHIAMSEDRLTELKIGASAARSSGIEVALLTPDEIVAKHPLLNPAGVVGGIYYPHDGRGSASDTTIALARGATGRGVRILEHTAVTDVILRGDTITGVRTDRGDIEAEIVVNATGMWGREFARLAGVDVPLQAVSHYYVVTDEIPGLQRNLPTIKSGDDYSYVKDEAGALMVGFFEPGGYPWASRGIPAGSTFTRLPEDWEHLGPFYEQMTERFPILANTGIRLHFCGPESFTPDGLYHLGPAPNVRNYFVAAGFNSIGFLSGPGAGSVLADLIVDGRSEIDVPELSPWRTQRHETNRRFLELRATETLDTAYAVHWPFQQKTTARGLRRSPLHDRLSDAGAVFGELCGWERANWYAPPGVAREYGYSFGRQSWFDHSAAEHRAVRENVGLVDTSSFGKLLVQGRDALTVLQRVCTSDIDVAVGRIVYTQWLNEFGGIEADVTVTRVGEREFLVLSGPATLRHDHAWLLRQIGDDEAATVADVSGSYAMLSVMGPRSRDLLQPLTDADLSNEVFAFGTSREIDLGWGFVRANRLTYVGELGWELLVPADIAAHVYDLLVTHGEGFGLRHAGYHALNSLRLEKAYRSWGHDISGNDTPLEAGLGFTVAWDKDFLGREALLRQREAGVERRLVQLLVEESPVHAHHDSPVFKDGELVGKLASVQYGHTLGGLVGLAWVHGAADLPRSWYASGDFEVEVALDRVPAQASLTPMYDPRSERVTS